MLFGIMSRVEILTRLEEMGKEVPKIDIKTMLMNKKREQLIPVLDEVPLITSRRTDITEIARRLFGNSLGKLYFFLFIVYQIGTEVAFSSIFSSSFASNIPLGNLETCDVYNYSGFYNNCK